MPDSAQCARAARKGSETRCICKFCDVPLHRGSWFEKYLIVRNCQTVYMQFLCCWVQEFYLYNQIVRINEGLNI